MPCGCGPKCCQNFDDDKEGVSDADLARFGEDDIVCPSCGASVYHDAVMCSKCGHAMTDDSVMPGKKWLPITAGVLLAGLLAFALMNVL